MQINRARGLRSSLGICKEPSLDLTRAITPEVFGIVLGLSFFFGLAYEEFYSASAEKPPGGVRTFPFLAILGLTLFGIDPRNGVPFVVGLIILGAWMFSYYSSRSASPAVGQAGAGRDLSLVTPICVSIAYILGPATLVTPLWLVVGITVASVLLLTLREPLHAVARTMDPREIRTAAQFLVLSGIVLPLLPDEQVTTLTTLTPYDAWLALVAISTLSYASYLLQRYVAPKGSEFYAAVLGGLYSSTVTTIVLARRMRAGSSTPRRALPAIILTTTAMYLRLGIVVTAFNLPLARVLALPLLGLTCIGLIVAALARLLCRSDAALPGNNLDAPQNPLELKAASIFAVLFVAVSIVFSWVKDQFGQGGLVALAAILGVTDIDPIVLSVAQQKISQGDLSTMAAVILLAATSNNLLKAIYAVGFGGWRGARIAAGGLAGLALVTGLVAYLLMEPVGGLLG
jgi:uncharacterized membrane protein (DUF4010 family)